MGITTRPASSIGQERPGAQPGLRVERLTPVKAAMKMAQRCCPFLVLQFPCHPEQSQGICKYVNTMAEAGIGGGLSVTAPYQGGPGFRTGVRTIQEVPLGVQS